MNIEVYFGSPDEIKIYLDQRPCGDIYDLDYIILDNQFTVKSRKLEQSLEKQRIDLARNQIRNLFSLNYECSLKIVSKKKAVSEKNIKLYYDLVYYEEHKNNDEFKSYLKNNSFNFEEIQNKTKDDIILDTKWAIILWFHSKLESKKTQKHMYLVFDQIDCYFGKDTLNSLLNLIRDIIEKINQKNYKLTIIFTSHSLKHEYFFRNYEEIKADIKKGSCINPECQHGYVKLLIGKRQFNNHLLENIYLDKLPMFVAITGKNAVGKTLLLKNIKKYYENSLLINLQYNFQDQTNTERMKININEYIKQIELYINEEKNQKNHIYDSILEKSNEFRKEIKYTNFSDSFLLRKAYLNVSPLYICIKSFIEILTFALMIADPDDLNEYLGEKLFKYEIKIQQNSILIDDINIDINVFFIERSNNTSETKLLHYNLSPGEKISLYIYLWEYLYQKNYDLATNFKCILIDEPDSHLHPTKCKELIQFIEEKLIKEMNFQVFITTHHPVTASFINDENLFLMYQSEDGETKLKNAKQCIIHPIDYLADNLFVLSKPIQYVFVESGLRKKFLEQIYKQCSFATLESKTDSNHLKLFKHSKLEFLVYDECVKEFKDTNKENNRLKKEIKEIIENLKSFNEIIKDNKTFKKYEKTLVSSVKRIKYSYFDPFHLDLINKYAQIIENALVELDEINDINKIVIKLFENFQKELNLFDEPKERAQLLRKKLIASVQNGNGLQLNNSSFSVGYVRNHSCFETKEFLIEELRRVENYLFDPVNIYLIMKEINFNNKFLNELKTLNEQQILEKIQEKMESIDKNLDMKTFKLKALNKENSYFDLDYKKFIFKSEEKLVDLIHDVFCDNQCSYKDYKPKNDCFFKILQEFFDKNYNLNYLNIYEKYSFGLLCLISEKKLHLLIPFELLRRFNYMELFLKYIFQTKYHPVHDLFEDEKFKQAKEIINGKENKINEFFTDLIEMNSIKTSFNNFIHMFIPDMSFRTPIHTLIRMSKFDEFFEICVQEKIDSLKKQLEIKEGLENSIIIYMFYFIESFKQITLNELEIYSDILQLIDRNQLKLNKDKDNFKSIVSSLKSVFEIIKENFKSTDTLFGLLKDISNEEDDESDQD